MNLNGRWTYSAVLAILSIPILQPVSAQRQTTEDPDVNSDLASMLQDTRPSYKQQEILSQALRIVHSMESAPTCNRLAALNLINDCKSLEHAGSDAKANSDIVLDEVKSEYAARLAVCELLGAKAQVPRECTILVPSSQACVKNRFKSFFSRQEPSIAGEFCYPDCTHLQFERCLRALEARPQSWTSYSNARQNAVVMCHASRNAIERDKDLSVYKSLTEVVDGMATMLGQSMQEMQGWIAEQMKFAEQVRMSQDQALQELQNNQEETLSAFDKIRNVFHSFAAGMTKTTDSLKQGLDETLRNSKVNIEQARIEMQALYREMAAISSQHAEAQHKQLQLNHETALASLQYNHESAIYSINIILNAIDSLHDKVEVSSVKVDWLNQGLEDLNRTVDKLGTATEHLRLAIDTTTETIQGLAALVNIAASPRIWLYVIICLIGLRITSCLGVSGFIFTSSPGILDLLKTAQACIKTMNLMTLYSKSAIIVKNQPTVVLILFGFLSICLLSFAAWSWVDSTYLYKYQGNQGEEGILPRIEIPETSSPPAPPASHYRTSFCPFKWLSSQSST
ncbi:hypothetical protein CC78DRAFT_605737 [Lojkania enalia]|uniref:Nuclear fusion protein KAR5 n=1 Tax=Lojkania enalia TaxID=147567 RepID=A0A9P4K6G5_9PLEO|nr:hypothetical protein CC78DRAFT_605737 [Didymosphaeria enalia]